MTSMARTADKRKAKHGAGSTGSRPKRQRVDKDLLEAGGRGEFFVNDEPKEEGSGSEPDAADEEAETAEEKRLRLGAAHAVAFYVKSLSTVPLSVLIAPSCCQCDAGQAEPGTNYGALGFVTNVQKYGTLTQGVYCAAKAYLQQLRDHDGLDGALCSGTAYSGLASLYSVSRRCHTWNELTLCCSQVTAAGGS